MIGEGEWDCLTLFLFCDACSPGVDTQQMLEGGAARVFKC